MMNLSHTTTRLREDTAELRRRVTEAKALNPEQQTQKLQDLDIDCYLLEYDTAKLAQYVAVIKQLGKHDDASQKEVAERIMKNATYKADILTDAELFVSGVITDGFIFTSLYCSDPEMALQYHERGFHYINRVLENNANLHLTQREITPEVEYQHYSFVRKLLLTSFVSSDGSESLIEGAAYQYWGAVRDTMGW
ncbi:hypothetical protein SI65_08446 [Aspergillus cristatus]|uniref:Uncharacterized protein n=1 Tax=Aspergillus cristatus TaxID=573508 RepID=A0A1E3B4X9_ASPCR|nr:hypothetical protein SI65_08446 [Aspergillus cristatus]